jgi:hypothetical protein
MRIALSPLHLTLPVGSKPRVAFQTVVALLRQPQSAKRTFGLVPSSRTRRVLMFYPFRPSRRRLLCNKRRSHSSLRSCRLFSELHSIGGSLTFKKAWPAVDQLISSISTLVLIHQGSFFPISLFPRRFGSCALYSLWYNVHCRASSATD